MVNISKTHVIKFIELVLAVVLVIMHFSSHLGLSNHSHIQTGTYVGFLIIFIGIFAVSVTGTPINRRIELYFCLVGTVLFIVSAVFIFNNEGNPAIKGSIAIIEGILLLIDGVFTFRGE